MKAILILCLCLFAGSAFAQGMLYDYNVTFNNDLEYDVAPEALEVGTARGFAGGLLSPVDQLGDYSMVEGLIDEEIFSADQTYTILSEAYKDESVTEFLAEAGVTTNGIVVTDEIQRVPSKILNFLWFPMYDPGSYGDGFIAPNGGEFWVSSTNQNNVIKYDLRELKEWTVNGIYVFEGIPEETFFEIPIGFYDLIRTVSTIVCCLWTLAVAIRSMASALKI